MQFEDYLYISDDQTAMCYWTAYVQLHSKFRKNSRDMQGFHGYSRQKNTM